MHIRHVSMESVGSIRPISDSGAACHVQSVEAGRHGKLCVSHHVEQRSRHCAGGDAGETATVIMRSRGECYSAVCEVLSAHQYKCGVALHACSCETNTCLITNQGKRGESFAIIHVK